LRWEVIYQANDAHVVTPMKPPGFRNECSVGRQFGNRKRAKVERMCVKELGGRLRFCVCVLLSIVYKIQRFNAIECGIEVRNKKCTWRCVCV
jgi:hypothetical protein